MSYYVEVDDIDESDDGMTTECAECGASIKTSPELKMDYGRYRLIFSLNCTECDFEKTIGKDLYKA